MRLVSASAISKSPSSISLAGCRSSEGSGAGRMLTCLTVDEISGSRMPWLIFSCLVSRFMLKGTYPRSMALMTMRLFLAAN